MINLAFEETGEVPHVSEESRLGCTEFVSRYIQHFPAHAGMLCEELLPRFEEAHENRNKISLVELFEMSALRKPVFDKILEMLTNSLFGVDRAVLLSCFPVDVVPEQVVIEILDELWAENKIRLGQTIELCRPALWEYIESIDDKKQRQILTLRLNGNTLSEIGDLCGGVTRERVRQIIKKCLRHRNKQQIIIEEDKFCEIFKKYSFSKEDFLLAFDVPESVYIYVTLVCEKAKGELPIEQFASDEKYPTDLRAGAERVVNKGYL